MVITAGVDLAAEPVRTGLAAIEWSTGHAALRDLVVDVTDDLIVDRVLEADKVGIDCPLGWPAPFAEFLAAHHRGLPLAASEATGRAWRKRQTLRTTDLVVQERTGLWPLSVTADRIAHAALRCAGLLAALGEKGVPLDRSGSTGLVAEVYPAGALLAWGLRHRGYKRAANRAARCMLVDELAAAAPWLSWGRRQDLCRDSDDALDAVVCALVARAAALGLVERPAPGQQALARVEGWIVLPASPLSTLAM